MKIFTLMLFLLTFHSAANGTEPPLEIQSVFNTVIKANVENDLKAFHSVSDNNMVQALTQENLDKVSEMFPGLKAGHSSTYFGALNKGEYVMYLWRIEFDNSDNDIIAKLTTKKNSSMVSGFWFEN